MVKLETEIVMEMILTLQKDNITFNRKSLKINLGLLLT